MSAIVGLSLFYDLSPRSIDHTIDKDHEIEVEKWDDGFSWVSYQSLFSL